MILFLEMQLHEKEKKRINCISSPTFVFPLQMIESCAARREKASAQDSCICNPKVLPKVGLEDLLSLTVLTFNLLPLQHLKVRDG
jgi:hypothetical protein